ncbi:MAG: 1-(5-phosphoribosyl)-5-[Clostridia bacterium]|nr:1-(5-phosphoribosyl)-5-[(5-phosphoribosylamino)methylideneamino]imidazole-4-carboxamide isomerase [Clostridia bacterium]
MLIFPAIDLYGSCAVRLFRGDYAQKTVYSADPASVAADFARLGARQAHIVDLEGAKTGGTPHFGLICRIRSESGLFLEVGGGIRNAETVRKYVEAGIDRVILGTAAVSDENFVREMTGRYGDKIAVGADVRDGKVAVRGWTETTESDVFDFCGRMQDAGVKTVICTDISKDGAMRGTNLELYRKLTETFSMDIIASGGVSALSDVLSLKETGVSGAIIGKAYYSGAVSLAEAIEVAR